MKNLKKVFAVIFITVMSATMLISCGGSKTSPEESAKIYLDVILKSDKTNMDKIGLKDEDYNKIKQTQEDVAMSGLGTSGIDSSILTDEIKTNFKDSVLTGISKLEYEVTPVSTDKETAKVNVKINYFKLNKIITDAQNDAQEKLAANPSMSQKELIQEYFEFAEKEFQAGPSKEDTTTVEVSLTKKNNVWVPDSSFESDISNVVMSMN